MRTTPFAAALCACITFTGLAHGQMLNNLSIGNPKALALGNAVTADPPGVDSIHFNPAGLSKIQDRQLNLKLLVAQVSLQSKFGDPALPSREGKALYYDINEFCQSEFPISNPGDANQVTSAQDACWGTDPIAGTTTSSGDPIIMVPYSGIHETPILAFPMGGAAFRLPGTSITVGSAVYVPEGIGYTRDLDSSGAYQGHKVALTRLTYFSPSVGMQITDNFHIGFGLNFSYQGMAVQTNFRAPTLTFGYLRDLNNIADSPLPEIEFGPYDNAGLLSMELEDGFSMGFNLGLLWEPMPWLTLGFVYHSESKSDMSGEFTMENSEKFLHTTESVKDNALVTGILGFLGGAAMNAQAVEKGSVEMEYIIPQNLALGVSITLVPGLKLNLDYKWAQYSEWDALTFEFDRNVDFLNLGTAISTAAGFDLTTPSSMVISRQYEDVSSWAVGVEYQVNTNWMFRAGYEPRRSAIPDDRTDLIFPIGHADLYTLGFGWKYNHDTQIDAAFGYMTSKTSTAACESENANSCVEGNVVYNPYYSIPFENEVNGYLLSVSLSRPF